MTTAWIVQTAVYLFSKVQPFLTIFNTFVSLILIPRIRRWYQRRIEWFNILNKQYLQKVDVVLFSIKNGSMAYFPLGAFHTIEFGERIYNIIVKWNDGPSDDLIDPGDAAMRQTIQYVMNAHVPPLLHAGGPYVEARLNDAKIHDPDGQPYRRIFAFLVRPDADKIPALHDSPRVVLLEENALMRVLEMPDFHPAADTLLLAVTEGVPSPPRRRIRFAVLILRILRLKRGASSAHLAVPTPPEDPQAMTRRTLRSTLRLLADTYVAGKMDLIQTFELPVIP